LDWESEGEGVAVGTAPNGLDEPAALDAGVDGAEDAGAVDSEIVLDQFDARRANAGNAVAIEDEAHKDGAPKDADRMIAL
jgi:hypothetical protein